MAAGPEKLDFLVHESPCSPKQVHKNVVCLIILCSSWPYKVHMSNFLCNCSWSTWNRLSKGNYWNKFRYSCILYFFSFSYSVITNWECHHLFLEDCEQLRILINFCLIKTKRSVFRLCLRFYRIILFDIFLCTYCVALFSCEYCHPPDNSLLTKSMNTIVIKSSFWGSVHLEYWQMKQWNDILQFPHIKAERLSKKSNPRLCFPQ